MDFCSRLIVLGLKDFSQTELPYQLMCRYLIRTKKQDQLRSRVKELCGHKASDNAIKVWTSQLIDAYHSLSQCFDHALMLSPISIWALSVIFFSLSCTVSTT